MFLKTSTACSNIIVPLNFQCDLKKHGIRLGVKAMNAFFFFSVIEFLDCYLIDNTNKDLLGI